jgi:hypothetical protein
VHSTSIGYGAGSNSPDCSYKIGIGRGAATSCNNSLHVIGIGDNAAFNNDNVNNVIALGNFAGANNNKSGQFIISVNSLPTYANSTDAATNLASPGSASGTRYLWVDLSTADNGSYTVKAYIVP